MVKPVLAPPNRSPARTDDGADSPRERYGSRRLGTLLLVRRARVQGEARAQRARVQDDDERQIASGL